MQRWFVTAEFKDLFVPVFVSFFPLDLEPHDSVRNLFFKKGISRGVFEDVPQLIKKGIKVRY